MHARVSYTVGVLFVMLLFVACSDAATFTPIVPGINLSEDFNAAEATLPSASQIETDLQAMAVAERDIQPHTTGGCDDYFSDAKEIPAREFILGLEDLVRSVEVRDTYDFVTSDGPRARSGPKAYWMQEAFEKYLGSFRPPEFFEIQLGDHDLTWSSYVEWRDAVCRALSGEALIRDAIVTHGKFTHHRTDWTGHASKWQPFPYLDTGDQVVIAPRIAGLEHYTKYIAGAGVTIVGGADVPDAAMLQARKSVIYMTSARPEFPALLKKSRVRISLFNTEDTSGLPEYQGVFEPGGFSQGLADSSMTANARWLCYTGNPDVGGDPVLHEMVHTLNHVIFEQLNETYFYERIYNLAEKAIKEGIFKPGEQHLPDEDQAGMVQWVGEYWATTVEGYLMNRSGFKNSHDTREWIQNNDPDLYDLIIRYFPTEPWDFCSEVPEDWKADH